MTTKKAIAVKKAVSVKAVADRLAKKSTVAIKKVSVVKTLTGKGAKVKLSAKNQPVAPKTVVTSKGEVVAAIEKISPKVAKAIKAEAAEDKAAKSAKSEQMKDLAKTTQATRVAKKDAAAKGAPMTPLTELFLKNGFVYAKSEAVDEQTTAHGYIHADGSVAVFAHANISTEVASKWTIKRVDGTVEEGKTAKALALALIKPNAVSAHVVAAVELFGKLTKGSFSVVDLVGEANYGKRVQLLKKLKLTDKILVKESTTKHILTSLNASLGLKETLGEADMKAHCEGVLRLERKAVAAVRKVEKEEIKEVLKVTGKKVAIHDDKPILPGVKKLNAKQQLDLDKKNEADVLAQITRKRRQEEYTPLAVPRPEATIHMDLDSICLLEDPNNGIVLMCLEKPNSQGAICVYNNGSRVAVGVVPTEVLVTLRTLISTDLIADVNQLLHPITAGVLVTPQAEQQLTAVLEYCKENLPMATDTAVTTKKFAPPAGAAKKVASKKTAAKAEKPAKAAKAPKAEKTPRIVEDKKIKSLVTLKSEGLPREGSFCYGQVEAIIGSKTISEAQAKLDKSKLNPAGRKLEVAWLVKKGYLQVAA